MTRWERAVAEQEILHVRWNLILDLRKSVQRLQVAERGADETDQKISTCICLKGRTEASC